MITAAIWLSFAFVLGLLMRLLGLPPLVGYLAAGFILGANGYETNHLQIVVKGSQIAVFVNGKAGGFATDPLDGGRIAFSVCNFADTSLEARWDNLQIWDITDL